ncbi:TetR/AcrR family transcriptional regulator [Kribbella deserti]|uniref:TetR/AcrR family transcriptional regulator n=1 Tax=Kribbella deserti TaxID=1926257 RepID=A0ABV6QD62_9ACTN
MTSTKLRALDAGIELLGTEGLRALTHGRIDERAAIPKGSTSNYFRTRAALLTGVAERIANRELGGVSAAVEPASPDEFVDALAGLIEFNTGPQRIVTAARLVLFLEANHNEEVRAIINVGRGAMEASVVLTFARFGAKDPHAAATALMACCEGIILHRIARHDTTDPRPALALAVRAAL